MNLFLRLLCDESGLVLPAEAIVLGVVGVAGAAAGLTAMSHSVNDELAESAFAIRSIDQSFQIEGDSRCGACIAGSHFTQQPVEKSLKQLRQQYEKDKAAEDKKIEAARKENQKAASNTDESPKPPKAKKPGKNRKKAKPDPKSEEPAQEQKNAPKDARETDESFDL